MEGVTRLRWTWARAVSVSPCWVRGKGGGGDVSDPVERDAMERSHKWVAVEGMLTGRVASSLVVAGNSQASKRGRSEERGGEGRKACNAWLAGVEHEPAESFDLVTTKSREEWRLPLSHSLPVYARPGRAVARLARP